MKSYLEDFQYYTNLYIASYMNIMNRLINNIIKYNCNVLTLMGNMDRNQEKDFCFSNGEKLEKDGLNYHYMVCGEKDNKPIIFLHGIALTATIWQDYYRYFSKNYRVYSLDFLGHGCSTKKRDLSMDDLIKQVKIFIEEKNIDKPIIVGHSLGGLIAAVYTAMHPEKVDRLISISSVDYDSFINDIFNKIVALNLQFIDDSYLNCFTIPFIAGLLEEKVFNKPPSCRDYIQVNFAMYHYRIKGMMKSMLSLMKNYKIKNFSSSQYKNINCPALIIHGNRDRLISCENAKHLRDNIPKAEVSIINEGSHMVILENREEVIKLLEEFI